MPIRSGTYLPFALLAALCLGFSAAAASAKTCKQVNSCEEAVELWCNGYSRADGDNDGIPCENVCHSRDQVDKIRETIGCR